MAAPTSVAISSAPAEATCRPLLWLCPLILFLVIFFAGPLLLNLMESLRLDKGAPTFAEYTHIFGDPYYLRVIAQTLIFGIVVTAICIVLGYPLAIAVARLDGTGKALLIFAVVVPLLINVVVRSFGWMVILSRAGAFNWLMRALGLPTVDVMYTWTGVTIALVHVLLPFMVLAIASTLETLDPRLEEAARVLGASRARVFRHVTLPLSFEGLITGSILCFTLTIGSFVTVMLLGKTSTMIMPLLIYQQLTVSSNWPFAAAMGMTLLVIVTAVLWLQLQLRRPRWRR
ncbi:MAG TPA: ABC transporter permease [Alphaproteobacteria bacterium]|nr:ABC transporter permease [Alphaproteobacteria bacterium]